MIVLITGCSTGIGRQLCTKMKQKGYTVIATARRVEALSNLTADERLTLDVTDEQSIEQVYDFVCKKYGTIDILVNNAGYSVRGALEEISMEAVEGTFDVNVFGMIRMIQTFAPMFRKKGNGKIINIGSVSGRYTQAANGSYCASKHAVEAVTEAARYELAPFHVQVTVLEPGPMETEFFHAVAEKSDEIMTRKESPYYDIYKKNIHIRDGQRKTSAVAAVDEMVRIIEKKRLRTRYFVALPYLFRIGLTFM